MTQGIKSLAGTVILVLLAMIGLHEVMQQFFGWHPVGMLNMVVNIVLTVFIVAWRHP